MFLLGILSIFQVCLLPGLVAARFFSLTSIDRLVLAFPLSLLCNYCGIYALTLAGWYTLPVMIGIIVLEVGAIFYLYGFWPATLKTATYSSVGSNPIQLGITSRNVFLFLALFSTSWLILKILVITPTDFNTYDDVCNWNRWAITWYKGQLPFRTWEYPQLLPINWSIPYKLTGFSDVEYFPGFINGLFPIYTLGAFWALYYQSKDARFLIAITVCAILLKFIFEMFLGHGMADIPSAFFGTMLLYVAYLGMRQNISFRQFSILGALIVTGAAATKQAGNYNTIYYLGVLFFIAFKTKQDWRRTLIGFLSGLAIISALGLSWYAYQRIQYLHGHEQSNVYYVTQVIFEDKTYWQRFVIANQEIMDAMTWLNDLWPKQVVFAGVMTFILAMLAMSLLEPLGALSTLLVVMPFYLIWATLFSYGHNQRNFGLAVGYLSFCVSSGYVYLFTRLIPSVSSRNAKLIKFCGMGLLACIVVSGAIKLNQLLTVEAMTNYKIYFLENRTREGDGQSPPDSMMYKAMYKRYYNHEFDGPVLTNYGCDKCNHFPGTDGLFITDVDHEFPVLENVIMGGTNKYYLLVQGQYTPPWYKTNIDRMAAEKKLTLLETNTQQLGPGAQSVESYALYKINLPVANDHK